MSVPADAFHLRTLDLTMAQPRKVNSMTIGIPRTKRNGRVSIYAKITYFSFTFKMALKIKPGSPLSIIVLEIAAMDRLTLPS